MTRHSGLVAPSATQHKTQLGLRICDYSGQHKRPVLCARQGTQHNVEEHRMSLEAEWVNDIMEVPSYGLAKQYAATGGRTLRIELREPATAAERRAFQVIGNLVVRRMKVLGSDA